jgi:hypothetical protein
MDSGTWPGGKSGETDGAAEVLGRGGCKNKHGKQILKCKGKGGSVGTGLMSFALHGRLDTQTLREAANTVISGLGSQ